MRLPNAIAGPALKPTESIPCAGRSGRSRQCPRAPAHDVEAAPVLRAEALQHTRDAAEDVFIRIRIAASVSMRGFNYQEAVADLLRLLHDSPPEG